jgi:cell division protein FtsI/penicillin-binding protein 2
LLAAGITILFTSQSILIISGNIRFLPLTGVTLPFVSYGGSSLLISFVALLLLIRLSSTGSAGRQEKYEKQDQAILRLTGLLLSGLIAIALFSGFWVVFEQDALRTRTDNYRRSINDLYVMRGSIYDRSGRLLTKTVGESGSFLRQITDQSLNNILGYSDPIFGQTGIESSMDPYLRGNIGNPLSSVLWNRLVYGQSPPGIDLRLSLDVDLQTIADEKLHSKEGAVVLVNAESGEILVMSSSPGFDENQLNENWEGLVSDSKAPLMNRATQGSYQTGAITGAFMYANSNEKKLITELPDRKSVLMECNLLDCIIPPQESTWDAAIASGCPAATEALAALLGAESVKDLFNSLGFFEPTEIRLPEREPSAVLPEDRSTERPLELLLSPLQLARAAASISNQGILPALQLVTGYRHPEDGWQKMNPKANPRRVFDSEAAERISESLRQEINKPIWSTGSYAVDCQSGDTETVITWSMAGTTQDWPGSPFAVVVILEEQNHSLAEDISNSLLDEILN